MGRTPRATVGAAVIAGLAMLTAACGGGHHHQAAPDRTPSSALSSASGVASSAVPAVSSPTSSAAVSSAAASSATTSGAGSSSAAPLTTAAPTKASVTPTPSKSASAKPAPKPTPVKPPPAPPVGGASGADVLAGTNCQIFPADNYWHADIASLPVDPRSAAWLNAMGASTRKLHPDFGPSGDPKNPYGIPVTVVPASQKLVPVTFQYADESDKILYPLGPNTLIEGGANSGGDMHAIMVTSDCQLFETWDTTFNQATSGWTAGSGAHWLLSSDALRNLGTSADAAGLPILPGLLRYDEVKSGHVDHAIRFTTNVTSDAYLWPARHEAGSQTNENLYPPMGARFRLKADFNIKTFSAQAQTVLKAMQTYGLVLADNGSPWYFQGTADNAWPDALIEALKTIPASVFEAVNTSGLEISVNSGAAR